MIVSGDDALGLLRKWFEERTPVKAFFVSADSLATVIVSGFVNGLSNEGGILISSGSLEPKDAPHNYIQIEASRATKFDYGEVKDLPDLSEETKLYLAEAHGIASLSILFSTGERFSIFERREPVPTR